MRSQFMPNGIDVKRHRMPNGNGLRGTLSGMPKKGVKDQAFEDLLREQFEAGRKRLGLSQAEVAKKLDFSQGQISKWLSGDRQEASAVLLKRMCNLFGIDPLPIFKSDAPATGQPTPRAASTETATTARPKQEGAETTGRLHLRKKSASQK